MNATRIKHGIIAGLAGGVVFGLMMARMGTLPMIGKMVGAPNAGAGWAVHLMISAAIGGSFAFLFGALAVNVKRSLGLGMAYGSAWWVLGPLTLMPLMMGMGFGVNWNAAAASAMLPSLMGHAIFGLILGAVYGRLNTSFEKSVRAIPKAETGSLHSV